MDNLITALDNVLTAQYVVDDFQSKGYLARGQLIFDVTKNL